MRCERLTVDRRALLIKDGRFLSLAVARVTWAHSVTEVGGVCKGTLWTQSTYSVDPKPRPRRLSGTRYGI